MSPSLLPDSTLHFLPLRVRSLICLKWKLSQLIRVVALEAVPHSRINLLLIELSGIEHQFFYGNHANSRRGLQAATRLPWRHLANIYPTLYHPVQYAQATCGYFNLNMLMKISLTSHVSSVQSDMWLLDTELNRANLEHFHYLRKF